MLWIIIISANMFFYQNCAQNDMSFTDMQQLNSIDDIVGGPPREIVEIPPEEEFIPSEVPHFECKSFVETDLRNADSGTTIEIPARNLNGVCYVFKLMDAMATVTSKTTDMERDHEVVSRDHDKGSGQNYPYVMGKSNLHIKLNDARRILLSGDAQGSGHILVDNFILVGVKPLGGRNDYNRQYIAYGTKDSGVNPGGDPQVVFRDILVDLIPFASSGTSSITPLALENKISVGHFYQFDIRSLDAGSVAKMSDIYLLIQ